MNKILGELNRKQSLESKGVYFVDGADIEKLIDSRMEEMKQSIYEDLDADNGVKEGLENLNNRIDELAEVVDSSLSEFSVESNDLHAMIESLSSVREEDANEMGDMLVEIHKKIDGISSKGESLLSSTEKKVMDELKKSIQSLEKSMNLKEVELLKNDENYSKEYGKEITLIHKKFKNLDDILKKIPKDIYEFGAQLQVMSAGLLVGITSNINFKSGFTVVANGLGIDITATANNAFPQMTTTQRLALTPVNGQTAYDTTLGTPMIFVAGVWATLLIN